MLKSKLLRLYQTLDLLERRKFKKWLHSPLHNQRQDVLVLFDFLASRSEFTAITLRRERAFAYIYPEEVYQVQQFNHLLSYAYKVLEKFIEYLEAVLDEKKTFQYQILAYQKRGLDKIAQQKLKKAQQQLHKTSYRNADFHLDAYTLETYYFELEGGKNRTKDSNLPQVFQHLSEFFLLATLRYACIAATHTNVYKKEYHIPFLQEVLAGAQAPTASAVVQLYYHAYQALSNLSDAKAYQALKTSLDAAALLLPPAEQRDLLLIAINCAIKRSHTQAEIYIKEALDLYQKGLASGVLLEQQQLSKFAYKNIIALALRLGHLAWAKGFIETYTPYLPAAVQQTYQDYGLAKYHFAAGAYDDCMSLLIQVEYDDLFMNIDAKMMLLKIYYTKQSIDALEALTQSFNLFLQRKEVLSYHKKNYLNVIRITKKMLHLADFDVLGQAKVREEILQTEPLTERQWLLEQLGLIGGSGRKYEFDM